MGRGSMTGQPGETSTLAPGPAGKPVQCRELDASSRPSVSNRQENELASPGTPEGTRHKVTVSMALGRDTGFEIIVDTGKGRRHDLRKLFVEHAGIVDGPRAVIFDQGFFT